MNHRRKLVPTFYEKLVWASGDSAGLQVTDTPIGRIGGLICGENTNPLARYSLIAQGEQIHISSWPALWPTRRPAEGGNDNVAANRLRAGAHSFKAKAFGIICAGSMDEEMRDFLVSRDPASAAVLGGSPRTASMFVDPTGTALGDMLREEEGIAYAEFDLSQCVEPKQFHDVVGYYNRFDVFSLSVNRNRHEPLSWTGSRHALTRMATNDPMGTPDDWGVDSGQTERRPVVTAPAARFRACCTDSTDTLRRVDAGTISLEQA